MISKYKQTLERPVKRLGLALLLLLGVAAMSACVPDEETFKEDNPPPPSFGTGGSGPDLAVTITVVTHDDTFGTWVFFTVTNSGNADAGSFTVGVFENRAAPPVVGLDTADATDSVSGLTEGSTVSGALRVDRSDNSLVTSGTAYAAVDVFQEVSESSESNNVSAGTGWGAPTSPFQTIDFEDTSTTPPNITSSNTTGDISFNWGFDTITTAASGLASAISGPITDNQFSCLDYDPSTSWSRISFYRRVSSELSFDFLVFYLDGVDLLYTSGDAPWAFFSLTTASGSHTFSWCYEKDELDLGGSDAAWIDLVEVQ
jgi:hypothetical protein